MKLFLITVCAGDDGCFVKKPIRNLATSNVVRRHHYNLLLQSINIFMKCVFSSKSRRTIGPERNLTGSRKSMYATIKTPLSPPDISTAIRYGATETEIKNAYRLILPWFVTQFSRKGGVETLSVILERLGNPQNDLNVIHVGGTNGKGSVSKKVMEGLLLAKVLNNKHKGFIQPDSIDHIKNVNTDTLCLDTSTVVTARDFKNFSESSADITNSHHPHVGLFTSPHISSLRERLIIDGNLISESDFIRLFYRVTVATKNRDGTRQHLSFFEMLTAMMFIYFYEGPNIDAFIPLSPKLGEKTTDKDSLIDTSHRMNDRTPSLTRRPYCDYSVIEVGLGGRLDSTNITPSSVCSIITSIGWDHMEILGSTLEEIAKEKAGIFKERCPVVLGPNASCFQSIQNRLTEMRCHPVIIVPPGEKFETFDCENQRIAEAALQIVLGSQWNHQRHSVALKKCQAFRCQHLSVDEIERIACLISSRFNERQFVKNNRLPLAVYLDVGHNRTALQRFISEVQIKHPHDLIRIVCSLSNGRSIECLTDLLQVFIDRGKENRLAGLHYIGTKHFRIQSTESVLSQLITSPIKDIVAEQDGNQTIKWLKSLLFESSNLLELQLLPENLRPVELSTDLIQQQKEPISKVSYSDALSAVFLQSSNESSVLVICGSVFIMQDIAKAFSLPLEDIDPVETNERKMPLLK